MLFYGCRGVFGASRLLLLRRSPKGAWWFFEVAGSATGSVYCYRRSGFIADRKFIARMSLGKELTHYNCSSRRKFMWWGFSTSLLNGIGGALSPESASEEAFEVFVKLSLHPYKANLLKAKGCPSRSRVVMSTGHSFYVAKLGTGSQTKFYHQGLLNFKHPSGKGVSEMESSYQLAPVNAAMCHFIGFKGAFHNDEDFAAFEVGKDHHWYLRIGSSKSAVSTAVKSISVACFLRDQRR